MSGWVGGKKEGKMGGRERERMARWMGGSISPPRQGWKWPRPSLQSLESFYICVILQSGKLRLRGAGRIHFFRVYLLGGP